MTAAVDLFLLETWQRFEDFCYHLARAQYLKHGQVVKMARSHDRGLDVAVFMHADEQGGRLLALQCKFTKSLDSNTKRSILRSLDAAGKLPASSRPQKYILCLPIDPTTPFVEWYRAELAARGCEHEIWGRAEILALLDEHPHVLEAFFYRVFAELEKVFVTDDLELKRMLLDPNCDWAQPDQNVLTFISGSSSADLVLDVIVRNRGRLEALLMKIRASVGDWSPNPKGFPPQGVLFPKITYQVSIGGGRPGNYVHDCVDPLTIAPGANERFKIRLTDTGATWIGFVRIGLDYGEKVLLLPCIRLCA